MILARVLRLVFTFWTGSLSAVFWQSGSRLLSVSFALLVVLSQIPALLDDSKADQREMELHTLLAQHGDLLQRMASRWGWQKAQRVPEEEVRS